MDSIPYAKPFRTENPCRMRLSKDDYTDARQPPSGHAERRCTRPSRRRSLRSPNLKLSWLRLGIDSPRSGSTWLRSTPTRGLVCSAHEWAQNIARKIDWLAMYLTHR